jgi:hypothetical protein
MLMNALAPSISHAMAARQRAGDLGNLQRRFAAGRQAPETTPDQADAMADCGYCLPHGGSFALMPSTISGLGLIGRPCAAPFPVLSRAAAAARAYRGPAARPAIGFLIRYAAPGRHPINQEPP